MTSGTGRPSAAPWRAASWASRRPAGPPEDVLPSPALPADATAPLGGTGPDAATAPAAGVTVSPDAPGDPEPAETSGATTSLILRHVRAHGGPGAVDRLLRLADVPYAAQELEDLSRWVSYDTRIRLLEAATVVLDDPMSPRAMGAAALHVGLAHSLVLLLRALGSPAQVYRQMHRAVPKFTTTSTMEVLRSSPTRATIRYRLHDPYPHSRLDCLYTQGLLSVVPVLFGLPAAKLLHPQCQSDGYDACVYHVSWNRHRSWWRPGGRPDDPELVALRAQLDELQSAATDLVRTDDLAGLVRQITERAAAAVLAPSYLLALHDPDGGPPRVQSRGLAPGRADELAARLLAGQDLGAGAVVVQVASHRRVHGLLAALHAPDQQGPPDERALLSAYAGHAAAALDLMTALERSRRGESRSTALLSLAHDLRSATEPVTVARVVADAAVRIVGSDASTVYSWDAKAGRLTAAASAGLTDDLQRLVEEAVIEPPSCPELTTMLTSHEPVLLSPTTTAPTIRALLEELGLSETIVAPLLAGGEFLGVVTAAWTSPQTAAHLDEPLARLAGLAEFAATALQNASLLGTVRHQSLHDALTRLPNRVLFQQRLDEALQAPGAADRVAILFCDLDRFKQVNDVHGHAAGDELLRQAAERLRCATRPGDVVARLSGDEFAVLLEALESPEQAADVAAAVVAALAAPFRVDGLDLRVTTSVGVAVHRGQEAAADALLRAADGAMYVAKQRGRNQVAHADGMPDSPAAHADHPSFERELRSAVRNGELRLHFQPLVSLAGAPPAATAGPGAAPGTATGGTVGVEALLRWEHPALGLLGPAAFLALAEETDVVVDLDLWAVQEACRTLAGWDAAGHGRLHVAVNASARTLCDPRLHTTVREALASTGLDPSRLCLEVVESRSLADMPGVADHLAALRRLGVRVSLDDFGTGYSTLAWLQRLPVDQLKLDRSFTGAITRDGKSLAVAKGVLALAEELHLEVVAEGVETPEQLALLRAAGFRLAQGYLWGRPQPASAIAAGRDRGTAAQEEPPVR